MHERLGDAVGALHFNDLAMVYNAGDPDLLTRKDRYYFSVTPDQLRQAPESIRKGIDLDYCLKKSRQVLSARNNDLESIDWALHLAELASTMRPELIEPRVLRARALIWKGERDQALQILEDTRENKPEKFAVGSDEDAWYRLQQMLGDLYLNDYARPDLAVPCYLAFRESVKSGADTLFKLGQAHEALGDLPRALSYFEQVVGYTEHPRYYDAQEALRRLRSAG
jgi:tetratricopeptide (TPR) repeat protein